MKIDNYRAQLEVLNQELSSLTEKPKLVLSCQTGEAEKDSLYLYGIIGGKDVGKTTLINQLAGARISIDTDILDEGTSIAVAYCHLQDQAFLQKRFALDVRDRLRYVTHQREELRNVVLIDFPDFDSRFMAHRQDVQRLARYLQGILWILSPRKYGDHEFVDQYEAMAQSNENHFLIMNKMDQLEGKVEEDAVRDEVYSYFSKVCKIRNIYLPGRERLLLISALEPSKYDYHILQNRLIRVHTPAEILRAKAHNLKAEFEKNITRIHSYYALSGRIAEIEEAVDEVGTWTAKYFTEEYFESIRTRVIGIESIQQRISAGLFSRRVDGWPVLRVLFYPLAGLISFAGGRFAFLNLAKEQTETPKDILRYEGLSASGRIQQIRLNLEEKYPKLASAIGEMPSYTELVEHEFQKNLQVYEEKVGERLAEGITPPGKSRQVLIYAPLIWFPFLQPLLLDWISNPNGFFSLSNITGLIPDIIKLLGAGQLLENAIFLILFYLAWLIGLYAQGARLVQTAGKEEFQNLWYEKFLPWITEHQIKPLLDLRIRWINKRSQIDAIGQEIQEELDRLVSGDV